MRILPKVSYCAGASLLFLSVSFRYRPMCKFTNYCPGWCLIKYQLTFRLVLLNVTETLLKYNVHRLKGVGRRLHILANPFSYDLIPSLLNNKENYS